MALDVANRWNLLDNLHPNPLGYALSKWGGRLPWRRSGKAISPCVMIMRNYVIVASSLVIIGVGVSLLVIPGGPNIAPVTMTQPTPPLTPAAVATTPPASPPRPIARSMAENVVLERARLIELVLTSYESSNYAGTITSLTQLKEKYPDAIDDTMRWIWVRALSETGAIDAAILSIREWMGQPLRPGEEARGPLLADLCDTLPAEKALPLIEERFDLLVQSPELVVAYVTANLLADRADVAYAILKKLDAADRSPPQLATLYFKLAVVNANKAVAQKLLPVIQASEIDPNVGVLLLTRMTKNGAPWKKLHAELQKQLAHHQPRATTPSGTQPEVKKLGSAPAEKSLSKPVKPASSASDKKPSASEKPALAAKATTTTKSKPSADEDNAIVSYVGNTPKALYDATIRKQYFPALARVAGEQTYESGLQSWVELTTDTAAILDYAATAKAQGYRNAANNGFRRVLALDPTNATALNQLKTTPAPKSKKTKKQSPTPASEAP
jgi:hypothetical protein